MLKPIYKEVADQQFHFVHEKAYQNKPAWKMVSLHLHKLNNAQIEMSTNQQPPASHTEKKISQSGQAN